MSEPSQGQSAGPSTDRQNNPVIDPTQNVRELVDAAILRQDDLRRLSEKYTDERQRVERKHNRETLALRAEFSEKIRNSQLEVSQEKFSSVETQFELVERQRVEQKKDTKDAVDAALAAAKEAVKEQTTASERAIAKSEAATAKQLDQQSATFATSIQAMGGQVQDMKERIGKIETLLQERVAQVDTVRQTGTDNRSASIATFSAFIAALSLIAVIVFALLR